MLIHGKRSDLVDQIIEVFSQVYVELAPMLRTKKYAKQTLALKFKSQRIAFKMNKHVEFYYRDAVVANFIVDFLVEDSVVVHLHATEDLLTEAQLDQHDREIYTYLKSADVHEGVMLNFGPEPSYIYKTADHYTRDKHVWTTPN